MYGDKKEYADMQVSNFRQHDQHHIYLHPKYHTSNLALPSGPGHKSKIDLTACIQ